MSVTTQIQMQINTELERRKAKLAPKQTCSEPVSPVLTPEPVLRTCFTAGPGETVRTHALVASYCVLTQKSLSTDARLCFTLIDV